MKVVLKPLAINQLKTIPLNEHEGIRIEAIFVGSCALFIDHHLYIDNKKVNDKQMNIDGIDLLISKDSQEHLPETIYIDYNDNLGYKLYSNEETYRYNLQLGRK
ncbi:Fe-S cluster assembly iron-binding protein IscA [Bacillus mesophilus]|uniref:Iron-sulfur cluster biosynthesis family protein n=1 Tax=Bacillus mesophilus TaxID=1808955 RepID=A0A6M0QBN5_9BACI|nr:iron-sulfur cluster biosynthesis family protein [Bacillus mesophilus]MBM7662979.1 Fe-S cluster assembly iron-binding protein IscA [Bacillus mesophilus]NEY73696.1 iron-sulfur cluster biosynthesis family protein [Bacillus mesophilus]